MTVDFCCYCLCELMTFLTICVTRPCLIRCAQWTINGLLPHMSLTRCHPIVCCAFIQMLGLYFALLIHSYPCRMCVSVYNVCILMCPCVNVCESIEAPETDTESLPHSSFRRHDFSLNLEHAVQVRLISQQGPGIQRNVQSSLHSASITGMCCHDQLLMCILPRVFMPTWQVIYTPSHPLSLHSLLFTSGVKHLNQALEINDTRITNCQASH